MPTRSTEDYLKHIHQLSSAGSKANTGSLASLLGISPASVSEMVSRLSSEGWISNKPYHGFQLTPKGKKVAVNLIRKHRLMEVFLHQHLKYEWDEVHAEAEKLEHAISDHFINKLEEYLDFPKFDPHGDPIPDKYGNIMVTRNTPLAEAEAGTNYIVSQVSDISYDILKYISKIGIRLNTIIQLNEKLSFDGSVLITLNNKQHLLSKKIAENIFVVKSNG